jgi:hypothetical protein
MELGIALRAIDNEIQRISVKIPRSRSGVAALTCLLIHIEQCMVKM